MKLATGKSVRDDDVAWTTGRLVFRDASLARVAGEIHRCSGVTLDIDDRSFVHVTASFAGERHQVLKILGLTLGARVDLEGHTCRVTPIHGPNLSDRGATDFGASSWRWALFAQRSRKRAPVSLAGRAQAAQTAEHWSAPLDRLITPRARALHCVMVDRVAAMAKLRLSYSTECCCWIMSFASPPMRQPSAMCSPDLLRETESRRADWRRSIVLAPRPNTVSHESTPDMLLRHRWRARSCRRDGKRGRRIATRALFGSTSSMDAARRATTRTLSGALDSYVQQLLLELDAVAGGPAQLVPDIRRELVRLLGKGSPKIYIERIASREPVLRHPIHRAPSIASVSRPEGSALYGTDAISGSSTSSRVMKARGHGIRAVQDSDDGRCVAERLHTRRARARSRAFHRHGIEHPTADLHVRAEASVAFIPAGIAETSWRAATHASLEPTRTLAATARFFTEQAGTPNNPLLTSAL